ncbi:MAG: NTE family protein [Nitriliruptoraceae bacterium]|jgi:NTE family protein
MRIGLVLGAGGYPGWPFQLAVLDAVEQYLAVDLRHSEVIVGTSVGAMVALLLRAGFSASDMLAHAHGEPMSDAGAVLLHDVLEPAGSLPPAFPSWKIPKPLVTGAPAAWWAASGQGRRRNWVPGAASLLIPRGRTDHSVFATAADSVLPRWPDRDTWIVAMRAADGARRVFGRDAVTSPGLAVTASSSIPGYFAPVAIDGTAHVDAGVLSSTHADLLADRTDLDLVLIVPPLAAANPYGLTVDAPLRWLVNAQIADEVAKLRAAGHAVAVASPPVDVVRAMQGDPMRMSPARVARALDATHRWIRAEAGRLINDAIGAQVRPIGHRAPDVRGRLSRVS